MQWVEILLGVATVIGYMRARLNGLEDEVARLRESVDLLIKRCYTHHGVKNADSTDT